MQVQERMDKFGRLKPEPEMNALKGSKMEGPQDVRLKLFRAMPVLYIEFAMLRRPLCMILQGSKPHSPAVRRPKVACSTHPPAGIFCGCAHVGDGPALRLIVLLL